MYTRRFRAKPKVTFPHRKCRIKQVEGPHPVKSGSPEAQSDETTVVDSDDANDCTAVGSPGSLEAMVVSFGMVTFTPPTQRGAGPSTTLEENLRAAINALEPADSCAIEDDESDEDSLSPMPSPGMMPINVDGDWPDTDLETMLGNSRPRHGSRGLKKVTQPIPFRPRPKLVVPKLPKVRPWRLQFKPQVVDEKDRSPDLDFGKRPIKHVENPHPLFDPRIDMPPHLHAGKPAFWQWLWDYGFLDQDFKIRVLDDEIKFVKSQAPHAYELRGSPAVIRGFAVPGRAPEEEVELKHNYQDINPILGPPIKLF